MVIRLYGAGLEGVDAFPVDVEVDLVRQGLPGFTLVGLAALGAIPGLEKLAQTLHQQSRVLHSLKTEIAARVQQVMPATSQRLN